MKIGLTHEQFEFLEIEAKRNCVVIGGYCKNNCIFCGLKAQASTDYCNVINWISTDDLNKVLHHINESRPIFFGEGRNFFSCEPFSHPNYIALLRILDEHFPNTRKITTSVCKGLSYEDLEKIRETTLRFVAGINTFDPDSRKSMMRSNDDLESVVRTLKVCKSNIFKASFVYTGDLDVLKRDIDILHKIDSHYIDKTPVLLRLADYTKFHRPEAKELHDYSKKTWGEAVKYLEDNVKHPEQWIRDLNASVDSESMDSAKKRFIKTSIRFITKYQDQLSTGRVAILLAESVYYYVLEKYPKLRDIILLVKNNTFGGSHIVTPLLGKDDILETIKNNPNFDKYLLHNSFANSNGKDITGRSYVDEFKTNNVEFFN